MFYTTPNRSAVKIVVFVSSRLPYIVREVAGRISLFWMSLKQMKWKVLRKETVFVRN